MKTSFILMCVVFFLAIVFMVVPVAANPTFGGIAPASGPIAGGTVVIITGTDFTGATAVTFDSVGGTSITVNSDTQIAATTPAHAAGAVNVVVTTPNGTASGTGAFTYVATPTFISISPSSGPTAGGTVVTIVGTNFVAGSSLVVSIGGTAATSVSVTDATHIVATTPSGTAGAKDIVITNGIGGSTATGSGAYTYVASPTIASITQSSGYNATVVSITNLAGTGFATSGTPVVVLMKSGLPNITATSVSVTATQITCTFEITGKPAGCTGM